MSVAIPSGSDPAGSGRHMSLYYLMSVCVESGFINSIVCGLGLVCSAFSSPPISISLSPGPGPWPALLSAALYSIYSGGEACVAAVRAGCPPVFSLD